MRSAPSNCDVISYRSKYGLGIGTPRPSFFDEFEPIGTRLITSTPHAIATSTTPAADERGGEVGRLLARPALRVDGGGRGRLRAARRASHAVRVTLKLCSPTWLTQPPTTWPTSAGSMPVRAMSSDWTMPSSSAGCIDDEATVALADRRADGVDDHD